MPNAVLDSLREKYPAYAVMDDESLAAALVKKYPQYAGKLGPIAAVPAAAPTLASSSVPRGTPDTNRYLGQPPGYEPNPTGGGLAGAASRFWQAETTPLVDVGGAVEKATPEATSTAGKIASGVARGAGNVASSLTTPLSLETLALAPAIHTVPIIAKALLSLFTAQQGLSLAKEGIPAIGEAIGEGNTQKAIQKGTEAVGQGTLAALAMRQGLKTAEPEESVAPPPKETLVDVGPNAEPVVRKANGDTVAELPPADPIIAAVSDAVLSKRADVAGDDLHGFAKWFSDEYMNGKPVEVRPESKIISETEDTPDKVIVHLSDRDSTLSGLWHELSQHAGLDDGHTLTADTVPHDNTEIAADAIDRLVPQSKVAPKVPISTVAGRGLAYPDDQRGGFRRALDLVRGIAERDPVTGGAVYANISNRGAMSELLSWRNEQLANLNEEAGRAVRQIPNAGVSAKFDLFPHMSEIVSTMGSVPKANEFVTALIESRKQGLRQMWSDLADEAQKMPSANEDMTAPMIGALEALRKSAHPISKAIPDENKMSAMFASDPVGARGLMASIFNRASEAVGPSMIGEYTNLDSWMRANPQYKNALAIYKGDSGPEDLFNEVQEEREGPFSKYLGPLDTYVPLVAMDEAGQPIHSSGRGSWFAAPGNPHASMATGISPGYAADMRAVVDSLAQSKSSLAKASAIDTLLHSGIGTVSDTNPVSYTTPSGKAVAVSDQPIFLGDGSKMWVPDAIMKGGLREALDRSVLDAGDNAFKRIFRAVNSMQMAGQLDLVAHNLSIAARFAKQVGNLGTWSDRTVGRLPFLNYLSRSMESLNPDAWDVSKSALARDNLDFAVKNGVIPRRVGQVTNDPIWAAMTGADLRSPMNPTKALETMTYGPQGTHIRTILQATDMLRKLNPDISHQQYFKAISEYGLYTPELEGTLIRFLKATTGPFATAGQSMARAGKRIVTLGGKMPFDSQLSGPALVARAEYLISRGVPSAMLGWFATHYFLTGKWPSFTSRDGKTEPTPLFGIREEDLKPSIVRSPTYQLLSKAMTGDRPGHRVIDLTAIDPVLKRGLRYTGVSGAYDAYVHGGSIGQAMEQAMKDAINSRVQIGAGPPAQLATTAAFGVAPHLTDIRDRGVPGIKLLRTAKTAMPGLPQAGANLAAAAVKVNPIIARAAGQAGLGERDLGGTAEQRILRFVANLVNIKPVRMDYTSPGRLALERLIDIPREMLMEKLKERR